MQFLRSASFGGLFTVTFTVAATSQVAFSLLGLLMVGTSPAMFKMNGAPATNPAQALGVLVFLLAMLLIMNAGMSAIGAGIWVLVRRALPGMKPVPAADTDVF
ncbi:hypothetical protein ASD21_04260 [Caulobacter sp. Root1455]|uniref:hypothetical protein n=1 Tax=Caulobacter sp. Root1455 TaxID=1736465 RepID=UPI0006F7A3EA|nr:hypothetical protein [Caulobacter sp. Root1455]KQY95735.1 hypothetical protein ASD21_04260 [Caulobacter sp. Root1455]